MLKRQVVGLITAIGLLAIPAFASAATYKYVLINGKWVLVQVGSIDCSWTLSSVPGTTGNPAEAECAAEISSVQIACVNPTGKVVTGDSATQVILTGQAPIDDSVSILKLKGTATVDVTIPTASLDAQFNDPQYCVNPNWTPFRNPDGSLYDPALVTSLTVVTSNYKCDKTLGCAVSKTLCSRATLSCTLPKGYSPLNMPPIGTEYTCSLVQNIEYMSCK